MGYKFKFIDLFAGIGGFHQALATLGGEVVFASEIDEKCVETYENHFDFKVSGDIKKHIDSIPQFDLLSAGFPCQPFSKAGKQEGFNDKTSGSFFYDIIKILERHPECKFIILENVRNLGDKKQNWDVIQEELKKLNFFITEEPLILSPNNFGIPQNRERVYILGIRKDIKNQQKLKNGFIHIEDLALTKHYKAVKMNDAFSILEENICNISNYYLSKEEEKALEAWQFFKDNILKKTIGTPIWVDFFGVGKDDFYNDIIINYNSMPDWKKKFVKINHDFYLSNKVKVDKWLKKYDVLEFKKTLRKFEWNCGSECKSINEGIIQFRQSGIRVKKPTKYPSLVAIVNTPIIWDKNHERFRHITPREAANLQSFDKNFKFIGSDHEIYKQLGNSVNVHIIEILVKSLLYLGIDGWDKK